jgi:hypothetical protein
MSSPEDAGAVCGTTILALHNRTKSVFVVAGVRDRQPTGNLLTTTFAIRLEPGEVRNFTLPTPGVTGAAESPALNWPMYSQSRRDSTLHIACIQVKAAAVSTFTNADLATNATALPTYLADKVEFAHAAVNSVYISTCTGGQPAVVTPEHQVSSIANVDGNLVGEVVIGSAPKFSTLTPGNNTVSVEIFDPTSRKGVEDVVVVHDEVRKTLMFPIVMLAVFLGVTLAVGIFFFVKYRQAHYLVRNLGVPSSTADHLLARGGHAPVGETRPPRHHRLRADTDGGF